MQKCSTFAVTLSYRLEHTWRTCLGYVYSAFVDLRYTTTEQDPCYDPQWMHEFAFNCSNSILPLFANFLQSNRTAMSIVTATNGKVPQIAGKSRFLLIAR